jgi:hypothetical protein
MLWENFKDGDGMDLNFFLGIFLIHDTSFAVLNYFWLTFARTTIYVKLQYFIEKVILLKMITNEKK